MNRRALKRRLKAQRREMRAQLAAARARRRNTPARRKRSLLWRLLLLLILITLYLFLRGCDCAEGGPIAPAAIPDAAVVRDAALPPPDAAPKPAPKPRKARRPRRVSKGRTTPVDRPDYRTARPKPQTWLAALRMQVASRGPRLARCFEGTDRPGALRWQALLDVPRGLPSDHRFEPVLAGAPLTKARKACLRGVLSTPAYTLPAAEGEAPAQVSIIVEF